MKEWSKSVNSNGVWYKLYVKEQSQSIEDNTTTLAWYVYAWNANVGSENWFAFRDNNVIRVKIGENTVYNTNNYGTINLASGQTEASATLLVSDTITISHATDGSKTCSLYLYATQNWQNAWIWEISMDAELTVITRASIPTLSASSVEFSGQVTIDTNRINDSFTHTLRYEFGSKKGTIASGVGASQAWTPAASLMDQIPSALYGTAIIYCDTYYNGTLIGTNQVSVTLRVPDSVVPTADFTIAEAASIPSGITGYVQSISRLTVETEASGAYGSTIKNYAVVVEGIIYNGETIITNTLTTSGTVYVKVTVKDSRGRNTTVTKQITVAAYQKPSLTGLTAFRCASSEDGTADPEGAYICVVPQGKITSLGNKNSKTCTVYYKKAGDSAYFGKSLAMSDYVLDGELMIFAANTESSYDIYAVLTDSFGSARRDAAQVMSAFTFIQLSGDRKRISLFKRAEVDGLDVGEDVTLRKELLVAGDLTYKDILLETLLGRQCPLKEFGVASNTINATIEGQAATWCYALILCAGGLYCISYNPSAAATTFADVTLIKIGGNDTITRVQLIKDDTTTHRIKITTNQDAANGAILLLRPFAIQKVF